MMFGTSKNDDEHIENQCELRLAISGVHRYAPRSDKKRTKKRSCQKKIKIAKNFGNLMIFSLIELTKKTTKMFDLFQIALKSSSCVKEVSIGQH